MADIDRPEFAAFMSYAHFDDTHHSGHLSSFRQSLSHEIQAQTGREFPIFQDREDISWGENWSARIEQALDATTFLIPIISPSFFQSAFCRKELERFAQRERDLGRDDLILPIHFIDCTSLLKGAVKFGTDAESIIASRQWIDWRDLRFESLDSTKARRAIACVAGQLANAAARTGRGSNHIPSRAALRGHDSGVAAIEFRVVNPGSFLMGSDHRSSRDRERPIHYVSILQRFGLGRTPVTVHQFEQFVHSTGYRTTAEKRADPVKTWRFPGFFQDKNCPVVCVSWFDALEYCLWLNSQSSTNYRLPTEAEWEFACRGGSETVWFCGDNASDLKQYAWLRDNSNKSTQPVGTKNPNHFGIYDLHGNAWEWCADWFGPYTIAETLDPKGLRVESTV
jgi:hypothetical protein